MKKFFRLMNAAEELSSEGNASAEESSSGNDFNDTRQIGVSNSDTMKELGLDPSKYGLDESHSETPKEESQGSEEDQEAGQAIDEKSYLDWVNSLGAIHNDSPVKVESIDEVKNALQMFKDYTHKTQTLSEERKGWDVEKSSAEKELNFAIEKFNTDVNSYSAQLQEMQQWTFTLNQLKESAPDLFEEVQRAYDGTVKQFSNPVLDQQFAAQNKRFEELEKKLSSREDKLIVDSFESEFAALAPLEQSLKELGITVNKSEVKSKWAATGLSPEETVNLMYGKMAIQAQASKAKVAVTAQKVAARPIGAAGNSRPGSKVPAINRKLSYEEQAMKLFNNMK